jgi:hypothetical protein
VVVVPSLVDTEFKNAPLTVPEEVIENETAAEVALDPEDAADQAGVGRAACEYVGAFAIPASNHPLWEAIVSVTAVAEYDAELIRPTYQEVI